MGVPFIQEFSLARYIIHQKIHGRKRYPLVLMLEPLFRCNLGCAGCGKINYPEEILNRRLRTEECLSAAEECGAPIVSIAGGEPLMHEEMPQIAAALIHQKKFVYLCTNGLLLRNHMDEYAPSPYLTLSIHLDGTRERHDALACRRGVFDSAVEAIKLASQKGFRVTVNYTLYEGTGAEEASKHLDFVMGLGVEGITVSPAYSYSRASQKEIFLNHHHSKELFREIFRHRKGHSWKFNQTSLYLDFLAGNQIYGCTPWGNPTRNIFGWQRPCYLRADGGYAPTFKALMEETEWEGYGPGRNPKCSNCMLHSGFEATAVNDMLAHPLKALYVYLRGPATEGPMAPELPITFSSSSCPRKNQNKVESDQGKGPSVKSL
jgi:hopanoid biosynthesis associated radical SAM protein HpnH